MSTEKQKPQHIGNNDPINCCDYYNCLFECAAFAIIALDCQGTILTCNHATKKILELEDKQLRNKHILTIIPEKYHDQISDAVKKAAQKQLPSEFEIDHINTKGKQARLAISIAPIVNDNDQLLGLAAWARDITNRHILQQQLLQAEKLASVGTLASGVAHHFNNIIGGVATFVDYALSSNNPQSSKRALQMTAEAAARIGELTRSLLTYAEKDHQDFDLYDLTEVTMTFVHLVEKPLADKNISLKLQLHATPIYEVPGTRINQVFGNLLDNAERAMPEGGDITIKIEYSQPYINVTFSDTGCGIDQKDIPHIFEPFFTTQGLISGGNQQSAGLGLSVVLGIVRELGGTIDVTSKPQQGTTFIMRFPIEK